MSVQKLIDTVQEAARTSQSLNIYVVGSMGKDYRSSFLTLYRGELVQFALHDRGGRAALAYLPKYEIKEVMTAPVQGTPSRDADTPSVKELLEALSKSSWVHVH
ncbi:hypothetical protein [Calidithermus chliarophilus]|uniref:hypothetical protein n=1 Tax=Calidithermus chliarophilus TaxID=52023 RepID=UPI0004016925|nr:hypothetical protein [Calidithermus chliarophilus]